MKKFTFVVLLLMLIMQLVLRLPFLHEPLEGDEGVYASIGQGIMAGEVPYRDFFDHKPPVVYYINALIFKLFGDSLLSIRLFAAFFALLGTLGIFWIGSLLWKEKIGLLAAAFYALFSGGPLIEGANSNTESFMIVFMIFALLAFVLALKDASRNRIYSFLLLSGVFSGLAFMTKQVAFLNFLVLLGFLFVWDSGLRRFRSLSSFVAGFLVFPFLFTLYFWLKGGLSDFINFAFLFNLAYVQSGLNFMLLFRTIYVALCENSVIWVLALAAVFNILFFRRTKWNLLVAVWMIFSFIGITSGGHYFGHYYLQVIPALCLLSGYAVYEIRFERTWLNFAAVLILLFLSLIIVLNQYEFYLKYTPEEISVQKYGHPYNVFARRLGQELKKKTNPGDYILEIGLPQIHFYSQRRSPGKYYSLARGGGYKIRLFGQLIYEGKFTYRISEDLYRMVNADLTRGLENSRTKFAVFQAQASIGGDFHKGLIDNFVYSYELSEMTGSDVLVFERKNESKP